jgi:asparagine synthase (glutamine-hydrolysing)
MCGIAGYHGLEADEALLRRMNDCQHHRGPDGEGVHLDGVVGLAHRRLSIIDVEHGQQPMTTADGRHTLVYNGEVYNYLDLRAELEDLGRVFATASDTEVVLQAFAEWGADAFDRFNGMFALAVWDREARMLTLARDHFGIKPVYVCRVPDAHVEGGDAWLFASEIRPILTSGHYDKRPDDRTIYRYLRFRIHEDGRETFFDGIERLEPGEMMTISAEGVERRPFTRLREELAELAAHPRPYDEAATAEFRSRLVEAVRLRLQSEVPVGTSLSGGIDSSALAVIINLLLDEEDAAAASVGPRQNTFSAVFPDSINDEERYVDQVLDACRGRIAAHKIKPTASEFKEDLRDFVRAQEEPLISSGPYAQYQVMREARKHVTVLLDGQGVDEVLAGYIPYYLVHLRQLRALGATKAAAELVRSLDVIYRLGRFKLRATVRGRRGVPTTQLLGGEFVAAHRDERYEVERADLKKRLLDDIFVGSLPALLRYEDKNTMHFSLEGRVPYLDKELLKFVFGLSDEAIIKEGWNKRILRDAVAGLLPASISRRRNKIGFTTPQAEWFMRLKNHIYGVFLSESFANRPYFDQTEVLHAFEGWIKGTNSTDSMTFWRLLNLELWLQEFFDEAPEQTEEPAIKTDYEPNARKQLDLELPSGEVVRRYPLRTDLFAREDDLDEKALSYVDRFFAGLPEAGPEHAAATSGRWYFFISEKIVAITQGRSYFIWDIKVGRPARVLSKYVTRTPAGIGLGSPFTMQLAIEEAGLPRVLYAAAGGAVGKLIGKRGLFYDLVGGDIRAIDGPTEYSVYPANVSAKLAPKDPDDVAARLSAAIRARVPEPYRSTFGGTVVMDANDIGRNALGKDAPGDGARYEAMFADNPLGQGSEQTPMAVVFEQPSASE